ncbi:serine-type carboxypeptidase TDEL_0D05800 [Torulaspora delbrueckii]|uniref:Carboxypeptidase n=1 Tax=Torulaspora delbrueckii TaxID=4950 RepID=G8ZU70_TORDE|nr:hypothetical protein TDEL_0D05800 [Torulaspora delbrueckii]CCE92164.1 hypothetical protein TDEL_0D05800 [Torulaspora delbrueckii]
MRGSWLQTYIFATVVSANPVLSAVDYYVSPELIPGLSIVEDEELIPEMYAGHIPFAGDRDGEEISYFFWKFSHPRQYSDSLVFWFNGGPGCSSMDGALLESGPFRVDADGSVYLNEGSWHNRADIVYVDQPVGTGFSTSNLESINYDEDLETVTEHFMRFIDSYFQSFPDDLDKELVLAGESYAGQYIPFFADAIMRHNAGLDDDYVKYKLKALLIGNGWVDPSTQSLSYLPFAVEKGLIDQSHPNFPDLLKAHEECQNAINSKGSEEKFSYQECEKIITLLLKYTKDTSSKVDENQVCLNVYDYTLRDSYPSCGMNWPEGLQNVPEFFSKPGVMEALHLDSEKMQRWHECDSKVLEKLSNPKSRPSVNLLPSILESGLDVFLFNGDHDFICNNKGVLDTINNMEWGTHSGFSENSQIYEWYHLDSQTYEEQVAGYVKHDRNLTFISVYNASHMIASDKSLISRGVLDIYMNNVLLEVQDGQNFLLSADDLADLDNDEESEDQDDADDEDTNNEHVDDETDNEDLDEHQSEPKPSDEPPKSFKRFVVVAASCSVIAVIAYFLYFKRFRRKIRAILVDPNHRHDAQNKTVSWADDLEDGLDFDIDQEMGSSGKPTPGSKKKGSYTSVPSNTVDESFELDDF